MEGEKILDTYIKSFSELDIYELYEILRLRNEVFVVEQKCPYQDCDEKDKASYHVFIKQNDKIIAYLRVINKGISYNEISIGRVVVDKFHRGKGYARDNMRTAIEFIENKLKENTIRISAQHYLLDFYKSLGFIEVSEVYLEDGIPHIEMLYNKENLE